MKFVLLASLFAPHSAHAINSYLAPNSTCASLQRAVQAEGSAVIYTKPDIYFLAVRGIESCIPGSALGLKFTKTRDNASCQLLTCKDRY